MAKMLILVVCLAIVVAFFGYRSLQEPRLDRNWSTDQAIPATAEITGDTIVIKNIRNFSYESTTEYTPQYYDAVVNLADVRTVDYIVEPFGDIGAAHTFLSFGLNDGRYIAVSVEIRKEQGESFSPWKGILNQYELVYVIADERDVIDLRANHRKHDVFLYPTEATPEQAQQLFLAMVTRANQLLETPEFYHTLSNNCTTNIARHINELAPKKIGIDYRLVLPEYSDILAQEVGLIAQGMTIEAARALYKINSKAEQYQGQPDFSRRIRERDTAVADPIIPNVPAGSVHAVTKVIDGDTIEVEVDTKRERVRYIGIDAPESYPPEEAECLAKEALARNESLLSGGTVRLVKDTRDRDEYGRLLRYVYVDDQLVNATLIKEGLAKAVVFPPDTREASIFAELEREAESLKLGIWGMMCPR